MVYMYIYIYIQQRAYQYLPKEIISFNYLRKLSYLSKKIRWKAIFYDMKLNNKNKNNSSINNNMKDNTKNNCDGTPKGKFFEIWNKNKCPPQKKDLTAFEEDMIDLVHQIRFRRVKSIF